MKPSAVFLVLFYLYNLQPGYAALECYKCLDKVDSLCATNAIEEAETEECTFEEAGCFSASATLDDGIHVQRGCLEFENEVVTCKHLLETGTEQCVECNADKCNNDKDFW